MAHVFCLQAGDAPITPSIAKDYGTDATGDNLHRRGSRLHCEMDMTYRFAAFLVSQRIGRY